MKDIQTMLEIMALRFVQLNVEYSAEQIEVIDKIAEAIPDTEALYETSIGDVVDFLSDKYLGK